MKKNISDRKKRANLNFFKMSYFTLCIFLDLGVSKLLENHERCQCCTKLIKDLQIFFDKVLTSGIQILHQDKTDLWKSCTELSNSWPLVFILMLFLNEDNQQGLTTKIFHRAPKWSWILVCFFLLLECFFCFVCFLP